MLENLRVGLRMVFRDIAENRKPYPLILERVCYPVASSVVSRSAPQKTLGTQYHDNRKSGSPVWKGH